MHANGAEHVTFSLKCGKHLWCTYAIYRDMVSLLVISWVGVNGKFCITVNVQMEHMHTSIRQCCFGLCKPQVAIC